MTRKMFHGICGLLGILLLLPGVGTRVKAQVLKNEEVDIVKPYQPLLADAVKIQLKGEPAPSDTAMEKLTYDDVYSNVLMIPFVPSEIKPLALPATIAPVLQNNLVKAGFGTQLSPLVEVYLGSGRSERYSYGLDFRHLSSHGSKVPFQDQSHTGGALSGTSYFENTALSGRVNYDRNIYYLYGGDSSFQDAQDTLANEDFRQRFQDVGVDFGLRNTKKTKSETDYEFRFLFHSFTKGEMAPLFPSQRENYFNFQLALDKQIRKEHAGGLDFEYAREDFNGSSDTVVNYFRVRPAYRFSGEKLTTSLGVNFFVVRDRVVVYPEVLVSYEVIGNHLVPYAGYTGNVSPAPFREMAALNPFIGEFHMATVEWHEGFAGIRGSYGSNITYNISGSYRQYKNLPVYLPVGEFPSYFVNEYYYESQVLSVMAEVAYRQSERLNLMVSGESHSFDMDFDDQPWGIPKNKGALTVNYNLQDKIIATAELFAQSGAFTIVPWDSASTQLKGFVDLNLSATYNYKQNLGFWLSFNNLANIKQREWYHYPYYGFRVMGGVLLRF